MPVRSFRLLAATSALVLCLADAQAQVPVPRTTPAAGAIVAAKGGEEMRFVREELWRSALIQQSVLGGDTLRTNEIGNLAILFADQTQIRVGRNSTLTVNDVAGSNAGTTQLSLQGGNIWARAARGGSGVDVKTPAAVAAIRGTDWSLSVEGGRTSLIVLEGVVELSNAQGSVTVRQGEGASVSIGQAPTKFVLTNSNDREQMLFYMSLRDTFSSISTSPLTGRASRAERNRVVALAPEARSAEDWLVLAEVAPSLDGRAVATDALAQARAKRLSAAQRARADLVEAALLGSQHRWSEAAALFARAERGLDPKRRIFAAYGRYVAQSLADPKRVYPEPKFSHNEPFAALAHAHVIAFKQDLPAAAEVLKDARERFPNDARVARRAAQVALTLNRREEMREAIAQAKALDPEDPRVVITDSSIRGYVDGEIKAAIEALRQAAVTAPGDADIWHGIGLLEFDRDRPLAAEEALRRAIEADPGGPAPYASLARVLLYRNRFEEAGALIDKALSLDPSFHTAYITRGLYLIQKGESAKGLEAILAGSAANPGWSSGLLFAAIAYYQNGDDELAIQALDNADRLDPNSPSAASLRTGIAIDQYQADQAVLAARETLRRYRQRGGDFAGLAGNKDGGSYPAQAYRFLNLNEWSRFYGDSVFDPFDASSYFDQSAVRRPGIVTAKPEVSDIESGAGFDPRALNLALQGLFFDPLAVAGPIGRADFIRRPFLDAQVGAALLHHNGKFGWGADANVQGFSNEPLPVAFNLTAGRIGANGRDLIDRENADNGSFFIGTTPTPADRFLIFGTAANEKPAIAQAVTEYSVTDFIQNGTAAFGGAGWSHSFGDRNVLTAAIFGTNTIDRLHQNGLETFDYSPFLGLIAYSWTRTRVEGSSAALSHMIGLGDVTLHYGLEAQRGRSVSRFVGEGCYYNFTTRECEEFVDTDRLTVSNFEATRLYMDAFWRPSNWFEAQAGIERSTFEANDDGNHSVSPRIGIGIVPLEGHWLRAAFRGDSKQPIPFTLAPVTTVGLVPNDLPAGFGGQVETLALRWDAEWSPYVFTSVEYQRQNAEDLNLPIAYSLDSIGIGEARIDRLAATANLWLTHGIGAFGTIGTISTQVRAGEARGADVPFMAGKFARAGMTFVHPSRLKFTLAGTFVGDIAGNLAGREIDDYWTADSALTWETPDRRLLFGLSILNILDEYYELAPDTKGPGRTFEASLKARF
ncbi:FecR domain-containing protein [Microvirga zambiensis]|uniref:FecR domain-containing protein n=1 Tax=Microvirga zambiensis TaxID=1402137 RepID=UPI00191F8340|nr:FecR domain-containing protein [Microvirga zambiensis]